MQSRHFAGLGQSHIFSSSCFFSAFAVSLHPNAVGTFFPTNQDTLFTSTVQIFCAAPISCNRGVADIPLAGYVAGCVRLSAGLFVLPHAPSLKWSASPTAGFSEMANGTCFGSLCGRKAICRFDRSTISFHQIFPAGNGHPFWSCTKIRSGRVIGRREQGSRSQRKRRYARY